MTKAKDAFRTISEVADWLDTPTHVLRFWESKFSQIKPVKGAGGRRYYRPADMDLLGGIKQLLHEDGLTIKGTQKLLREKGVKYVATLGPSITAELADDPPAPTPPKAPVPPPETERQGALLFDLSESGSTANHDQRPVSAGRPSDGAAVQETQAKHANPPDLPTDLPAARGRLIGLLQADTRAARARADQIAPLLTRLEDLRDRMRAG